MSRRNPAPKPYLDCSREYALSNHVKGRLNSSMETILKGTGKRVVIEDGRPTVILGERINPTGKKKLAAALAEGDLEMVRQEALAQVEAGADILDVNVGAAGVDEVDLLPKAVKLVLETVDVPVCIDTPNGEALEAALRVHQELNPDGRALVNSVPDTPAQRLEVARKIIERADGYGIAHEDFLIDCLALTVGADAQAAWTTLEAMRLVKEELGVNLALGASNVSFGLPDREIINGVFLAMAIERGLNCPIMDAAKVGHYIQAADLVLGRDDYAMRYLKAFRRRQKG
jgi:5-methyltetrahydrofolate--homocysteine methyltransferase